MSDRDCFIMMKRWMENRNNNKLLAEYFKECGYNHIAIYGAGDVGLLLFHELKNSDVTIEFFVDRNAEALENISGIPVILPKYIPKQKEVDCIIVTAVGNFEIINEMLTNNFPEIGVVSLKDIVYEM